MSEITKSPMDFFVDRQFQRGLLIRYGFYLAILLAYFSATMWVSAWVDAPEGVSAMEVTLAWASDMAMWLPISLILVPLAGFDLLRFSHRFVEPSVKLREQLHELAAGQEGSAIDPHDDALWQGTLEDFNQLRQEVIALRAVKDTPPAPLARPMFPTNLSRIQDPIEIPLG
jgi:hypothetical protein